MYISDSAGRRFFLHAVGCCAEYEVLLCLSYLLDRDGAPQLCTKYFTALLALFQFISLLDTMQRDMNELN